MRIFLLGAALAASTIVSVGPVAAQPDPATIIAQGDKNGDHALDKAEWDVMGAPVPYPTEADTNHDGKIDAAELQALFSQFGAGGPPPGAPPPPSGQAPAQ